MVHQPLESHERKTRIEIALREYLESVDRGEPIDKEQFLCEYADVAEELRAFISNAEEMSAWAREEHTAASTRSESRQPSQTVVPKSASVKPAGFDSLPVDLDRYHVQELLGRGAMGAVYLALDRQLDRRVAFKVPSFDAEESKELLVRFYHEARAAAHLHHPNICPVYDVGKIHGQHYIAMAYIHGKTLSQHMKSETPPSERQSLTLIRKLALGLSEAHRQGIIHRDLKPANVMIDRRGEPIVMDFGLACRVESEGNARLTHDGVLIGSPAYMSPEQVEGNPERVTPATDQYSLGVILYELLARQLPFRGPLTTVIAQVMHKEPVPPHEIRSEIDPRAEAVCLKMMSKSAVHRYPSMDAVAAAILKILREPKPEATDSKPAASPGVRVVASLAEWQALIQTLLKEGDIAGAKESLEAMAELKEPRSQKAARWAKQHLDLLKREAQHWQESLRQCEGAARASLLNYDYSQAIKLLESVPPFYRSKTVATLLEEASAKQAEMEFVQAELIKAIRKNHLSELSGLVKQYLKLNPLHRGVKQLAAAIKQWGPERVLQTRRGRKDVLAPVLLWTPGRLLSAAFGFAFVCMAFAVILFPTAKGTIVLEVHDPAVTLALGDDEVTVTKSGQRYQFTPTEKRTLQVKVDGVMIDASTQEITVAKNETKIITARLLSKDQLELTVDGRPQAFSVSSGPPDNSNPSLVAPFAQVESIKAEQPDSPATNVTPSVYKNAIGMEFVLVPRGHSWLGGGGNRLGEREVNFSEDFYLGKYEVTQAEWERIMGSNPSFFSRHGGGQDAVRAVADTNLQRFPVESITWDEIQIFLEKLNHNAAEPGWNYRLPTADEWEYACRGGPMKYRLDSAFHYYFSAPTNEISLENANYGDRPKRTTAVGSYPPNPLGLCDMHGNLFEWCNDAEQRINEAPHRLNVSGGWVTYGGSGAVHTSDCLVAGFRNAIPTGPSNNVGFRVACVSVTERRSKSDMPMGERSAGAVHVKLAQQKIATLPQAAGLPLRWLCLSLHDPNAVQAASAYCNLIQDRSWLDHGDQLIRNARKVGIPVLLAFHRKDWVNFHTKQTPDFQDQLWTLIRANRDVVAGVAFVSPYSQEDRTVIGQIGPFGQQLKQEFPGLSYWVAYWNWPDGWQGPLPPIPPEVDVVEMVTYFAMTPNEMQQHYGAALGTWKKLAGSRPVVLRWTTRQNAPGDPQTTLRVAPGTIRSGLQLAGPHALAGIVFDQYGRRADNWSPPFETSSAAIGELKAYATEYGYGRRGQP